MLAEDIHAGRTCKPGGQLLILFVGRLDDFQPALYELFIQIKPLVISMVVFVLLIRNGSVIAGLQMLAFRQHACAGAVDDRLEAHLGKILYRLADDPFKAYYIPDVHDRLFRQVLARIDESHPIAFREGIGHLPDDRYIEAVQVFCRLPFILAYILSEPVQISQVREVAVHDNIRGE